jgi:transcriptional regulator of acetoin/glycerol metabolism
MARGSRIDVGDLPAEIASAVATTWSSGDDRSLAEVEKAYILAVLDANAGNRKKTAKQLEIAPATLYRRLATYGITGG